MTNATVEEFDLDIQLAAPAYAGEDPARNGVPSSTIWCIDLGDPMSRA
ncbi:hypothetical protein [Kribbella sp. NPDC051718]